MAIAPPATPPEALSEKGVGAQTNEARSFSENEPNGHLEDIENDIDIIEKESRFRHVQRCCEDRNLPELRRLAANDFSTDKIRKIACQ